MAKRFTDNQKWDHAWFRKLTPTLKCAWFYMLDKCDSAGIWTVDEEAMAFNIGAPVKATDFDIFLKLGKIQFISSDKILILGFIEFQYGTLSEDCKPHKPVIERLRKLNLLEAYSKGFETLEEKEKEKDKEKDKEKEKEKEGFENQKAPKASDLEGLYAIYPRKEGKSRGLAKARAIFKTRELMEQGYEAARRYRDHHARLGTETKYLKHFDTWLGSWKDSLEDDFGTGPPTSSRPVPFDPMTAPLRGE